ncbi:MAG: hypothetical protein DMF78_13790 [Acidobacteria bacterium]|nr:MAG: hypothetical protein DMF78_13790 [Acidobacteriota bacterium]
MASATIRSPQRNTCALKPGSAATPCPSRTSRWSWRGRTSARWRAGACCSSGRERCRAWPPAVWCARARTPPRAAQLESLRDELACADIVITSTGAPGLVVQRSDVEAARASRGGRPLLLIDIALPRDVDPTVRSLPGVFLYDLDDLRSVSEANRRERQRDAVAAEALVEKDVGCYLDAHRSRRAVPLLVALRERGEEIRRTEIEKARRCLGPLTPDQERALDSATAAIVNKLLHTPTVYLKEMARAGQSDQQATLVRRVLGLA